MSSGQRKLGMHPALGAPYSSANGAQQTQHIECEGERLGNEEYKRGDTAGSAPAALVKCHFTVEELEHFAELMRRNDGVEAALSSLPLAGLIEVKKLARPNVYGKLLSYIKNGKKGAVLA